MIFSHSQQNDYLQCLSSPSLLTEIIENVDVRIQIRMVMMDDLMTVYGFKMPGGRVNLSMRVCEMDDGFVKRLLKSKVD